MSFEQAPWLWIIVAAVLIAAASLGLACALVGLGEHLRERWKRNRIAAWRAHVGKLNSFDNPEKARKNLPN